MTLSDILAHGWPDASWTLDPETYEGLTWHGPGEPPTEAEIEAMRGEVERAELRRYANAKRDAIMLAGFTHAGHTWDSDERSCAKLNGAVAAVSAGVPLPQGFAWTSADDADVAMTADELVALHAALFERVNAVHQQARQIKADIDAGTITTRAEVDAAFG